ncbi:MAG: membrane protein insertion efficiency factor YidD [Oligoflexia bacterium]|nr:membrane protein insertion efficiency factor YidD [Oligoflexia bacterium]
MHFPLAQLLNRLMLRLVDGLFGLYRFLLSPMIHLLAGPGQGCRFQPTCSEYAQQAVRRYGALKGGYLALRRIFRCNPFGGSGPDPVP